MDKATVRAGLLLSLGVHLFQHPPLPGPDFVLVALLVAFPGIALWMPRALGM